MQAEDGTEDATMAGSEPDTGTFTDIGTSTDVGTSTSTRLATDFTTDDLARTVAVGATYPHQAYASRRWH